jgi:hypothetical protein
MMTTRTGHQLSLDNSEMYYAIGTYEANPVDGRCLVSSFFWDMLLPISRAL